MRRGGSGARGSGARARGSVSIRSVALIVVVVLIGVPLVVAVTSLPAHGTADAPAHDAVAGRYVERGAKETGMANMVTAVLLDYRGFDTYVEVVVMFAALMAVLALPRGDLDQDGTPETGGEALRAEGSGVEVSGIVFYVVRTLAPFIALFAVAMVYRGHVSPGGGFQSAAVLAALFVVLTLTLGRVRTERLLRGRAQPWLEGAAPLAFALVGAAGMLLGGAFLSRPGTVDAHLVQETMGFALEVGIAVGGAAILARLFLTVER